MKILLRTLGVLVILPLATACMGPFALTRGLYDFNDKLSDSRIVNQLVFWAFVFILPVYELAIIGDALIFNVIHFWTGSNLLAANEIERGPGGSMRLTRGGDVYEARPVGERRVEVWRGSERVGAVELAKDDALVIENARGEVAVVPAAVLEAMEPALRGPVSSRR